MVMVCLYVCACFHGDGVFVCVCACFHGDGVFVCVCVGGGGISMVILLGSHSVWRMYHQCNGGVPPHRSTTPTLLHWNSPSPRDQKTLATLNSSAISVTTRYVIQFGLYPDLHYPRLYN